MGGAGGGGVLYDPEGLNREELEQLATKRLMCEDFDESCLSDDGFLVKITEKDLTLNCGYHVDDGVNFRNNFHVWDGISADFFVPCGGRPGSVHLGNVHQMFKEDGSPRYKYVVEGANLFITDGARDLLQDSGVILFKDASTNKGGVTSSSL